MKTCRVCGQEFAQDPNRRRLVCPPCKRVQDREYAHTEKGRESRRILSARRYRRGQEILAAMKDKPCADCGGRFPSFVMEFDHPDPSVKLFNIAMNCGGGITPKILAEIEKCEVVCANCHKIRTRRHQEQGLLKKGRPRKYDTP